MKCLAATIATAGFALHAHAAPTPATPMMLTNGTQVVVPASAEVAHANDQVVVYFSDEATDKDKAAAASRVNLKMKRAADTIKTEDPQAKLKSYGYFTYPIYPDEAPVPAGQAPRPQKPRVPIGWRVGQSLQVTTTSLATLPKMVAAAQGIVALNGLRFGLSPATTRQLDAQRIAATYADLNERVNSLATAMGRRADDAVLEMIDLEGSGNYARSENIIANALSAPKRSTPGETLVAEPSFEPGETTLQMRVVGKVRFK